MPWRRKWQPTSVFLPGEFHGWRSLAGYSPWGRRVRHDWSDLAKLKSRMIYTTLLQDVVPGKTGERAQEIICVLVLQPCANLQGSQINSWFKNHHTSLGLSTSSVQWNCICWRLLSFIYSCFGTVRSCTGPVRLRVWFVCTRLWESQAWKTRDSHWLFGKGWEILIFPSVSGAVSTALAEGLPWAWTLLFN